MSEAIQPSTCSGVSSLLQKEDQEQESVSRMRDDLKLLPGPPLEDGSPTWTLHDIVRNKFFRIGRLEFELMVRWSLGGIDRIIISLNQETTLHAKPADIQAFEKFLAENYLLDPCSHNVLNRLNAAATRKKQSVLNWLLHHYLFIRVSLVRPDRFLNKTMPIIRLLASRFSVTLLAMFSLLSLFLAMRQWESFIHTFLYFFSLKGIILYSVAIFFAKLVHEFGHAYTSKYYGLKVPAMGVAFLVLWPMLYTDSSESWKLKSRKSRMAIVAAGSVAEMVLASLATLLWSFLPDGPLRSACFIVATVTWISSLLLNLSPFMRFDGYYMLSDFLDVPNLQDRAFALGKWYLRKSILGIEVACPEKFSTAKTRHLIIYAYVTWIYRLVLFATIALMVYHLFFKVLGVFLFAVEIVWFVGKPIFREIKAWGAYGAMIKINSNIILTVFLVALLAAFLIIPREMRIDAPAVLKTKDYSMIYPPFSAQIREIFVKDGQVVHKGDPLFHLYSPRMAHDEKIASARVRSLEEQIKRSTSQLELLEHARVTQQELAEALTELQGLKKQKRRLSITAPADGVIMDMPDGLRAEGWVNKDEMLANLTGIDGAVLEGYLEEEEILNVTKGDQGLFYMENRDSSPSMFILDEIDRSGSSVLNDLYLASVYGGDIPVRLVDGNELVSNKGLYRVSLVPGSNIDLPKQIVRGTVIIKGKKQSMLSQAWMRVIAVLIRESGF